MKIHLLFLYKWNTRLCCWNTSYMLYLIIIWRAGSLTIGNINQNYGGGNQWNSSTAGLMLECADATEIAVHDSGASIHSLMYYSTNGNITIGRNMGWQEMEDLILGYIAIVQVCI
jgi:hypothetical protein